MINYGQGHIYRGLFVDGKRSGSGQEVTPYSSYIGKWLNDLRHGMGEETLKVGINTIQNWNNGTREEFSEFFNIKKLVTLRL